MHIVLSMAECSAPQLTGCGAIPNQGDIIPHDSESPSALATCIFHPPKISFALYDSRNVDTRALSFVRYDICKHLLKKNSADDQLRWREVKECSA